GVLLDAQTYIGAGHLQLDPYAVLRSPVGFQPGDIAPSIHDGAGRGPVASYQQVEERTLAGSVRPDQAVQPLCELSAHPVHGGEATEGDANVMGLENRLARLGTGTGHGRGLRHRRWDREIERRTRGAALHQPA